MQNSTDRKAPQFSPNSKRRQPARGEVVTTLRSVRQDKRAKPSAREATPQPARMRKERRAPEAITNPPRSQKGNEQTSHTVQLTIWVHPGVKAELERIAQREGLTLSKTAATALEQWVAQSLHLQHAGIIQPVIEASIAKHMRSYSSRIAVLLVRAIFGAEQTRSITTNILGRQPGVTAPVLEQILDRSSERAKRNITRVTPQLANLINEVEEWIEGREGAQQKE